MPLIGGKTADFPGWKMMTFRAREGRKGHAYTNKGDPGALPGLLRLQALPGLQVACGDRF